MYAVRGDWRSSQRQALHIEFESWAYLGFGGSALGYVGSPNSAYHPAVDHLLDRTAFAHAQIAGVVGMGLATLFVFQEKLLYVPNVPGVPADAWITADRYGLASQVRSMHAWVCVVVV